MERLPVEILDLIFQRLPQSIEGVRTLIALQTVEKFVGNVATGNPAWERQLARWQHSEPSMSREEDPAFKWYGTRARIDLTAVWKINNLIAKTSHRIPYMHEITTLGLNILDRLIHLSKVDAEEDPVNYLATRYWANKAVESLSRRHAITVWSRMSEGRYEDPAEAFEEGASAFGLFRGQTIGQVRCRFLRGPEHD